PLNGRSQIEPFPPAPLRIVNASVLPSGSEDSGSGMVSVSPAVSGSSGAVPSASLRNKRFFQSRSDVNYTYFPSGLLNTGFVLVPPNVRRRGVPRLSERS